MSRRLRTTLPLVQEQRTPEVVPYKEIAARDSQLKDRQKRNFDRHHRTKELQKLKAGEEVWIPDRKCTGIITNEVRPRSHIVETAEGPFRRNRRHLVRLPDAERTNQTVVPEQTGQSEQSTPNTPAPRETRSQTGRMPRPPDR